MAGEWRGDAASKMLGELAATGLNRAAEYLLKQSQALVPEKTESLENSATTHEASPASLASQVQYLRYYSVWQHEKLNYHHPNGGQAKYLEQPLVEHARDISNIIASEIERGL